MINIAIVDDNKAFLQEMKKNIGACREFTADMVCDTYRSGIGIVLGTFDQSFFVMLPLWQLIREEFHFTQAVEAYFMGIFSYILYWFVLHGLKICFPGTRYTMREHFPLSFFMLPLSTALIYWFFLWERGCRMGAVLSEIRAFHSAAGEHTAVLYDQQAVLCQ